MKYLAIALVLIFSSAAASARVDSYVARLNEAGQYCAKIRVGSGSITPYYKVKCRTIAEWKANGFLVEEVSAND